ncbi:hypothetical protein ABXS73_04580 [Intestinimonas butyriciproducens]|uniref:aspartate racemase/maleate isomerase family protein n=1 Tax=Intestinimonas butyriciproducens TaxID=1297617 RepID=UPI0034E49199
METELHRNLPEGLEMATTRVPFSKVTYDGLLAMTDRLPEAARILAEARPNVIGVTNFIASCFRGREMVNRIQQATGIPAVVPALEYVSILHDMGAKRITVFSCFDPKLRLLEELFFNENKIEVDHVFELETPDQPDPFAFSRLDDLRAAEMVGRAELPSTDAVLVDLPTFRMTGEVCAALSRHRDIPILSLTQVLLWSTFEKVGASREGLYLSRFLTP